MAVPMQRPSPSRAYESGRRMQTPINPPMTMTEPGKEKEPEPKQKAKAKPKAKEKPS